MNTLKFLPSAFRIVPAIFAALLLSFTAVVAQAQPANDAFELTPDIFKNVSAKAQPGGAKLTWSIDYDALPGLEGKELIIKYNTAIGAKQVKAGIEDAAYMYTQPMPVTTTKFELKDLADAEKYVFYVGVAKAGNVAEAAHHKEQMVWSSKGKFKTERTWGVMKLLILLGSLGLFIYGMKVMSEGLQQWAGGSLRKALASMTKNRVSGVLSGFGITAFVQSSSVTTVMTVSFVNAGLMTLRESAGVMMGANIGTTITAWLVLMLGFKVSISSYALILIALGAPFLFIKSGKASSVASAIFGFAILFLGLQFLKDAVPSLDADSPIVQFFVNYKDIPVLSTLLFVALGALVTVVIQSSSAAMTLTMAMVAKGIIPFEVACAMILGENIGTTITAEIASMIGNVHAKRSARIHSLFNVIGVTWMVLLFPFFLDGLAYFLDGDPFTDAAVANTGLALFHTAFNLANVLVMIWFVPMLVNIAERTVKVRGDADEEFRLEYIGSTIMHTPELSIMEAKKEIGKFGTLVRKQNSFVAQLLTETDNKKAKKLLKRIKKYEDITDRMEVEIANYLAKVSEGRLSEDTSVKIRSMLSIINDLERIGDIGYQMSVTLERKLEKQVWFVPAQREKLLEMFDLLNGALVNMEQNLSADYSGASITKAREMEDGINKMRNSLRKTHLKSTEKGEYNFENGIIYSDMFSSMERVGDHVMNVNEAIVGEV